jgi:hypothetical protein
MPTRSKQAKKRQKEEEAMAALTLQKEKDAATKLKHNAELKEVPPPLSITKARTSTKTGPPPPPVVSPPSTPNLNSLLSGHVGRDEETLPATKINAKATDIEPQADKMVKSPLKKKPKKLSPAKTTNQLSVIIAAQFSKRAALRRLPRLPRPL